jgi:pectinesterase
MSPLVIILFVPLFLSPAIFAYPAQDVKKWCSQTPHPQPCEYFLSHNPSKTPIKQKSDFLKLSKQLALERGSKALGHVFSLGLKCRNAREKAAWADCLELYQQTISHLNKTVNPSVTCTQTDAQTWLSTALTNLETCRTGFIELGVSDYVLPLMSNNVSKLISNTLAINNVHVPYSEPNYKEGLPTWVKGGDRKLLQSSSLASQANIVVANDGSGNYTTIKEAVTAASKRSGSGRYVIYVKAGTYKENVEIKLKNIMLVGDGIGKTIITGSKSVGGGATTFNSATLGKKILLPFIRYILVRIYIYISCLGLRKTSLKLIVANKRKRFSIST